MICPSCGKRFDYAVMAHHPEGKKPHIEDNIFVGDTLVHKANYDNPDVVASCPICWSPLPTSDETGDKDE